MKRFYIVKKEGYTDQKVDTLAQVFDCFDTLGRSGVTFEWHEFDTDVNGQLKEYISVGNHISRRKLKDGNFKYYPNYIPGMGRAVAL